MYRYLASERHAAYQWRVAGQPGPWTSDPIPSTFKFCNVYRAADPVSQYMIRDVCYATEESKPEDRLFQITVFRTFSKPEMWHAVRAFLGELPPTIDDLASGAFGATLEHARTALGGLYTGAFIRCGTDAYGQKLKHLNHIELFRHMFLTTDLGERLREADSLRQVYDMLHEFPLMDDFMSYQTAIDLNYGEHINFSENEFTQPGPGAQRGIKKAFEDLGDFKPQEVIQWMVDNQQHNFDRLGLPFDGLWGRPLHAIDCQGLFCELDKYCREAAPNWLAPANASKPASAQQPARSSCSFLQSGTSTISCRAHQCSPPWRLRRLKAPFSEPSDRRPSTRPPNLEDHFTPSEQDSPQGARKSSGSGDPCRQ